jgi:multiple sugar transport system ATP-binding protein
VAQVVLENVYKSFLRHQSRQASFVTAGALVPSVEEALAETPTTTSMVNVLRRINLEVKDGEFMVLVGPSGCGKSTLLRLIAGLEQVTGGHIWVGDRQVNDLPPKQRDIAMVFQNYALYPHMTVYDNLAFGLRRTKAVHSSDTPQPLDAKPKTSNFAWTEKFLTTLTRALPKQLRYWSRQEREIDQRIRTVAQILQIEPLLDRLPKQLSGGQKQRVALGRAMARNPQVFLMDEPLSNLDAKLRTETRAQIVNLQRKLGTTTIYVTHDQVEAMTMGDRIAVMNAGQIQQIAAPLELYNRPANRFVAEFIGSPQMNFLPVQVKAPLLITHPQFRLTLPQIWETALSQYDGRSLTLGIRPEHLSLSVAAPKNIPVQVERVEALGNETQLVLNLIESVTPSEPTILRARVEPDRRVNLGENLWLAIATDKIHLFDAETGEAIAHH